MLVIVLCTAILASTAALPSALHAQGALADSVAPLFASYETLDLTLTADFRSIDRDRGEERQEHQATLSYADPDGGVTSLGVKLRTRGNFRLARSVCEFPPLRLEFAEQSLGSTVFAGQDKLKLVTHCQDKSDQYEQYVLKEYLVYRMYGLLTSRSFRVRLARIAYVQTGAEQDTLTEYAFFVEDADQMAARNRATVAPSEGIHGSDTDDAQATLFEVFQYFVGNTDWSVSALHNVVLLLREGNPIPVIVPYDFDWSGVVDARYAVPPPALRTYSVRERVCIGPCRPLVDVTRVVRLFNTHRTDIYDLFLNQTGLSRRSLERSLEYFDAFFECVNDDRCLRRELIRPGCPGGR